MRHAYQVAGLGREHWTRHSLDIRIRIAAAPYIGWRYSLKEPHVAYSLPDDMRASKLETETSRQTNCSTLTVSLLTSCYPLVPWGLQEYGDLQVFGDRLPDHPGAPVNAVERMGIGQAAAEFSEGRWHLVQGWRRLDPGNTNPKKRYSGHAFLVLGERVGRNQLLGQQDPITILEASSRENNIGPRYRRTTVAGLRGEYPAGLFIARLDE